MKKVTPVTSWITVNRRCNFRCKWCYAEDTDYKKEDSMSFDAAKELVEISVEAGVKKILFIGGEPTLWDPLFKINEFCSDLDIQTVIVTNGLRFGEDKFWKKFRENPTDKIGLSLKAHTERKLKQVAGVSRFKTMRKGFERIFDYFEGVTPSITYNSFYVDDLPEMVKFLSDCGAKRVKIDFCSTVFEDGKAQNKYMVNPHQIVDNILKDYDKMENAVEEGLVFEMMLPFCLWPKDFIMKLKERGQLLSVCHVLRKKGLVFDTDGSVLMCNALFDAPIGKKDEDFSNGEELVDWLNSEKIRQYYQKIRRYPSEKCADCLWYSECGGGCPLRWALYKPENIVDPVKSL